VVRNICSLQAAANPIRGDVYVVYPDTNFVAGDKADIFFTMLPNGGSSWTAPVRVNSAGSSTADNDQWNPVIAVKPNGTQLFVGYYDRSADTNNTLIQAAGRIGTIDGTGNVTFGPRIQVSSAGYPVWQFDEAADYDTAAADDTAFYYTWSDDRNRMYTGSTLVNEANVRFTKIPSP
jgi:hypothetical protein